MATDDTARRAEIGLCVLLAASDGDISEREIGALATRLGSVLGEMFPAMALAMLVEEEIASISELGPDGYVASLAARLPEEAGRREGALAGALAVAAADGLAPEEEQMFRDVARALGIDVPAAERILADVDGGKPSEP
jgi:tellurite resistance protein